MRKPDYLILFMCVKIWWLTFYLFRRLKEFTQIILYYFGHIFINLKYKITL